METKDGVLLKTFISSMSNDIRFFANGALTEAEIGYLAEYEVGRLDFDNAWQMHKSLAYFARKAVENYLWQRNQ